jgi:hypothetical protein
MARNKLYVLTRRGTFPPTLREGVQGFDYEDPDVGFSISVREGNPEIRINGELIRIDDLGYMMKKRRHDIDIEKHEEMCKGCATPVHRRPEVHVRRSTRRMR